MITVLQNQKIKFTVSLYNDYVQPAIQESNSFRSYKF